MHYLCNRSIAESQVTVLFIYAVLTHVLKNYELDCYDLPNLRTLSILSIIFKLLDRLITSRIKAHLESIGAILPFTAYCRYHLTETALIKEASYVVMAFDAGPVSLLALLDLCAACDTADHEILRLLTSYI